jgi:hypothetical protein
MTGTDRVKAGDKASLYCPVCEEERICEWSAWKGTEFYGYPPEEEYGWKCTTCGGRLLAD